MGRKLYESLFESADGRDPGEALVSELARAGRLLRASEALASDEMNEGLWVEEEEAFDEQMRFAADDRDEQQAVYTGGGFTVEVSQSESGEWSAVQQQGPTGSSLRFGSDWVVLTPGQSVDLPIEVLPVQLVLVDLQGKEIVLKRA